MALIYSDFSIISVGMSCQTAEQIYAQKDALDAMVGETSAKHNTPFDWLICPPEAAIRLLDRGRFVPEAADRLRRVHDRVVCDETGAWYWHNPRAIENFDNLASRFNHMAGTLDSLAGKPVLAFWSNSQRNLDHSAIHYGIDIVARDRDLTALETALIGHLPRARLLPVIMDDRCDLSHPPQPGSYTPYTPDDSPRNWRGNHGFWREVFASALDEILTGQATAA